MFVKATAAMPAVSSTLGMRYRLFARVSRPGLTTAAEPETGRRDRPRRVPVRPG
jgi:hypothetical protein